MIIFYANKYYKYDAYYFRFRKKLILKVGHILF